MANSSRVSRRTLIKGTMAAALASSVGPLSAQTPRKPKKLTIMGTTDLDSMGTLAVWLALTARDQFDDPINLWTMDDASLAHKLVSDMGLKASTETNLKAVITLIRSKKTTYLQVQS